MNPSQAQEIATTVRKWLHENRDKYDLHVVSSYCQPIWPPFGQQPKPDSWRVVTALYTNAGKQFVVTIDDPKDEKIILGCLLQFLEG